MEYKIDLCLFTYCIALERLEREILLLFISIESDNFCRMRIDGSSIQICCRKYYFIFNYIKKDNGFTFSSNIFHSICKQFETLKR
jgi:hypothetical protein